MTDLGTLGGHNSHAHGINGTGQVVGYADTTDGQSHAFITGPDGVGMTDLGTLPGGGWSYAIAINEAGQVAGYSSLHDATHAFITGPNGVGMTDLGTLGGSDSFASGITDTGQVVGNADIADGQSHAFITGLNGVGMTDLNSLVHLPDGFIMASAIAINNMDQVLVYTSMPSVPEPETYALMLAGLVLTGVMVRRKQKVDLREEAVSS